MLHVKKSNLGLGIKSMAGLKTFVKGKTMLHTFN